MPIRLFASDMDGTLLQEGGGISAANVRAIHRAQDAGVTVALCSGRIHDSVAHIARTHGLCVPILSSNGAVAQMSPDGPVLFAHYMPIDVLERVLDATIRFELPYMLFSDDTIYSGREYPPEWVQRDVYMPTVRGDAKTRFLCVPKADILRDVGTRAHKVIAFHPDIDLVARCRAYLSKDAGLHVSCSWQDNIEIMPAGVTKGEALLAFARRLGIPREETMAIGDQENDLTMLDAAGVSVAMGNAPEWIRQRTTYVTGPNGEDGVAQAIERYVLTPAALR